MLQHAAGPTSVLSRACPAAVAWPGACRHRPQASARHRPSATTADDILLSLAPYEDEAQGIATPTPNAAPKQQFHQEPDDGNSVERPSADSFAAPAGISEKGNDAGDTVQGDLDAWLGLDPPQAPTHESAEALAYLNGIISMELHEDNASFCINCGKPTPDSSTQPICSFCGHDRRLNSELLGYPDGSSSSSTAALAVAALEQTEPWASPAAVTMEGDVLRPVATLSGVLRPAAASQGPALVAVAQLDERMLLHRAGLPPYPERPERLHAIVHRLSSAGLLQRCRGLPPRQATFEELMAVHRPELVYALASASAAAVVLDLAASDPLAAQGMHGTAVDGLKAAEAAEAAVIASAAAAATVAAVTAEPTDAAKAGDAAITPLSGLGDAAGVAAAAGIPVYPVDLMTGSSNPAASGPLTSYGLGVGSSRSSSDGNSDLARGASSVTDFVSSTLASGAAERASGSKPLTPSETPPALGGSSSSSSVPDPAVGTSSIAAPSATSNTAVSGAADSTAATAAPDVSPDAAAAATMLLPVLDPGMLVGQHTDAAARFAAGAVIDVSLEVASGRAVNGVAIVRPPGHSATRERAQGGCYFNSVAVAARAVQAQTAAQRILILDWDVHWGRGTQEIFAGDESILCLSLHRNDDEFYPNMSSDTAQYPSVNVAWADPGVTDGDYLAAFMHVVMPVIYSFAPDLILVSAGFDAADKDFQGHSNVSPACYAHMTHLLKGVAPCVLALEGGYNLEQTARSMEACVRVLLGERPPPLDNKLNTTAPGWVGIMNSMQLHGDAHPALRPLSWNGYVEVIQANKVQQEAFAREQGQDESESDLDTLMGLS